MVKNLPVMQETWVQSLGQEDPMEKGMATHSSILSWRIPGIEEPDRLQSMRSHRVGQDLCLFSLLVLLQAIILTGFYLWQKIEVVITVKD